MRIIRILLLGFGLLVPAVAAAQDTPAAAVSATHLAAARELYEILRVQDAAVAAMAISLDEQIKANPVLAPYREAMMKWGRDLFSGDEAKNAFAGAYASRLSEADLRELVAFFRTPVGQRFAENQAHLAREGAEIGRRLAEAHQAELLAQIQALQPKAPQN